MKDAIHFLCAFIEITESDVTQLQVNSVYKNNVSNRRFSVGGIWHTAPF